MKNDHHNYPNIRLTNSKVKHIQVVIIYGTQKHQTHKSGNTENFNFSLKSLKNASIVSAVRDFLIDSSFRSNLMEKKKEKSGNQHCLVLHHWNAGWSSWCTESSLSCPPSSSPDRGTPCRSHSYFNMNMWKHGVCFKLSIYNLLLAGSVNVFLILIQKGKQGEHGMEKWNSPTSAKGSLHVKSRSNLNIHRCISTKLIGCKQIKYRELLILRTDGMDIYLKYHTALIPCWIKQW